MQGHTHMHIYITQTHIQTIFLIEFYEQNEIKKEKIMPIFIFIFFRVCVYVNGNRMADACKNLYYYLALSSHRLADYTILPAYGGIPSTSTFYIPPAYNMPAHHVAYSSLIHDRSAKNC